MNEIEQNGTVSAPITARQRRALAVILAAPNMEEAARRARVGRTTLYNWLQESAFKNELRRQQNEVFNSAIARLKSLVGSAVNGLGDLVRAESESVRRAACRDILEAALKVKELHEIDERLTAIETRLEEKEHARN